MDIDSANKAGDTGKAAARRTEEPLFTHQPLDLDTASVRLVEVLPLGPGGRVECKIKLARLDTSVYTCVSYVWGPPDETHWITIDERPFEVRRNLWNFLHIASTLRTKALEGTNLLDVHRLDTERCFQSLWIDALCIDQENVLERNHQVQQMGQIYSKAERIISWLGTGLDLAAFLDAAWRHSSCDWRLKKQQIEQHWNSIWKLHNNVYWKRAWITQELILAHTVHLLANDVAIPLLVLHDIAETLRVVHGHSFHWHSWQPLVHVRHASTPLPLMVNLWHFRDKRCSDLRDAAYSLLYMSSDGDKLRVDYNCSLAEVARNVLNLYPNMICLHTAATIIRVMKLDQLNSMINLTLPFIAINQSHFEPSGFTLKDTLTLPVAYCLTCHERLPMYFSFECIFCLRCTWHGINAPAPYVASKDYHPGHLVFWESTTAHNEQRGSLYWAPSDMGQFRELEGHRDVLEVSNGCKAIRLSASLVCELMSLTSLFGTMDDQTIRRIVRSRHHNRFVQSWTVAMKRA
jgi:hypothetical protein